MKHLLLLTILTLLSTQAWSAHTGHFEEEVYIKDPAALKILNQRADFIIDHVTSLGFELFGPKGTMDYLKLMRIEHEPMGIRHHKKARDYPTFVQIERKLKQLVQQYPKIAALKSIGTSVQGRPLYVVKISDNVTIDEIEPEFKYISSMHGDEITGRELCTQLIEDLLASYGKDQSITELINQTEIYIMPSMNPDGSALTQRGNANGFDLNRNFPDWKRGDGNQIKNQQPETKAVMQFQAQRKFSLSANFHGGAVVVNYPWDNTYDRHPLDDLLQQLSLSYANLNKEMSSSNQFPRGITNGADWYKVHGGMQDWSYFWYGDLQVTVELSDEKWPDYIDIAGFYQRNKKSMLRYLEMVHQGFGIYFQDFHQKGRIKIFRNENGNEFPLGEFVFADSEFYKVLPTGNYRVEILRSGHPTIHRTVTIDDQIHPDGKFLQL